VGDGGFRFASPTLRYFVMNAFRPKWGMVGFASLHPPYIICDFYTEGNENKK